LVIRVINMHFDE